MQFFVVFKSLVLIFRWSWSFIQLLLIYRCIFLNHPKETAVKIVNKVTEIFEINILFRLKLEYFFKISFN